MSCRNTDGHDRARANPGRRSVHQEDHSCVVPKDVLPTMTSVYPTAFVYHTDDGYNPGQHWISIDVNDDRPANTSIRTDYRRSAHF